MEFIFETIYGTKHKARENEGNPKPVKFKTIEDYLGHEFESSTHATSEWNLFVRRYKKELKKRMEGFELVSWTKMHFNVSAFFKKDGKFVYVSCSDVRFFPDEWYNNILIRTAQHNKDYTGGMNHYASLPDLRETAEKLIGG